MGNSPGVSELDPVRIEAQSVRRFRLLSSALAVEVMEYGATVLSVNLIEPSGESVCISRGLARPEDYTSNTAYMGSICGRYAGRIANACFDMPASDTGGVQRVNLTANHGPHQLHGGQRGFDARLWTATPFSEAHRAGVEFRYLSADGEEGYPGALDTLVRYSIDCSARLWIEYTANAVDKMTPVNLTSHCYWNLGSDANVLGHQLELAARSVLEFNEELLPSGLSLPSAGTALDFSKPRTIADAHAALPAGVSGLDHALHNFEAVEWLVPQESSEEQLEGATRLPLIARVREPRSGRGMRVFSDQPLVILYAGNALEGSANHGGHLPHAGFCIECQQFPDAPNQPNFPSAYIDRGERYEQTTVYEFSPSEPKFGP